MAKANSADRPKQTKKVGGVLRKRRSKYVCDAAETLTWIAILFMLYRIVYLLRVFKNRQELTQAADRLQGNQDTVNYSKLKGIRTASGRTFLKYTSSPWEEKWSSFIDLYEKMDAVCSQINSDSDLVSVFFNATCTGIALDDHVKPDHRGWCVIDDGVQPIFYNRNNARVSGIKPATLKGNNVEFTRNRPIIIADEFSPAFSRFTFLDDKTGLTYHEYIEPFISRMRHPLDCCEGFYKMRANLKKGPPGCKFNERLGVSRTQYVPPHPDHVRGFAKKFYFDSGSYGWNRGPTGPTLSYFLNIWRRHNIDFDKIFTYEPKVDQDKFLSKIPEDILPKVEFHHPNNETDLIAEIKEKTNKDDYVLLRLDLGSVERELDFLNKLIQNKDNIQDYIDEFCYTFPVPEGNATEGYYGTWYKRFIKLREAGIRAHSWV